MLVLSRKVNEEIVINGRNSVAGGDEIRLTVVAIKGDKVRLGIDAPDDLDVDRAEVFERKQTEQQRKIVRKK